MSGQLLRNAAKDAGRAKHTRVVITFTQGGQLRFVDPRTFGEMFVVDARRPRRRGPRAGRTSASTRSSRPVSWTAFGQAAASNRSVKLKALLMDQKFIAGIGNIYADEILYDAGLRYDRDVRLAVDPGDPPALPGRWSRPCTRPSSTAARPSPTSQYVDLHGKPGEYQEHHQVYDREGEACRRCRGRPISQGRSFAQQCHVTAATALPGLTRLRAPAGCAASRRAAT